MASGSDPLLGTTVGSYEITDAIGEGGMARIYKGFHAELNRYGAIKVINWGLQEDPDFTERFRREAQAIASLRHPNIVQIFDFGQHISGYFMVMEFIDGYDLELLVSRYQDKQALMPKAQVVSVIQDVAAALDYAHERSVIHRDVKPSNIMINQDGQAILTDFGLVMLPAQQSRATLGNTFGTPHYVAPEQAISSAAAVPASDIYSLGVVLYELTTGQLPFDDESPLSIALKHVSDLPPAPTSFNPDLPERVEAIILKAMAKDPGARFTTAGELASTLAAIWQDDPATDHRQRTFGEPGLPAADIPTMSLPNGAAVDPTAAGSEPSRWGQAEAQFGKMRGRAALPAWLSLALVGIIGGLVGASAFVLLPLLNPMPTPTPPAAIAVVPTHTATASPTPTQTSSPTASPTEMATPTPTHTSTPTATFTPSPTATATNTATPTPTVTPSPVPIIIPTATPTPVGFSGKILFRTDRGGLTEIYRMDGDGSNQVPLSREDWSLYTQFEAELPFSRDKSNLIVVRGEGQFDLWWANLNTGVELRVTSTGSAEYDAAWSPVDNRVAYVSEETGRGDIYLLNLDGSAKIRLTENINEFDKHPTWSPDGTKLAFWSDRGFAHNRQIWLVDLATREFTSLSDNPFNDWDPVWVP